MSIIIQIGTTHIATSSGVAPHPACIVEAETTLDTGPDVEYDPEVPVTLEDNSSIAISTLVTVAHGRKEVRSNHMSHGFASCFGLPYQDHNYGAPPPPSPPQSPPPKVNGTTDDDTNFSVISTSTNNEEDTQEESITRCICGFDHDDEYMICCDQCSVWQHVDCMGLNRNNIPDTYLCEKCEPRKVDRQKAKALQTRKKEAMTDSTTDDSGDDENSGCVTSVHSGASHSEKTSKLRKRRKEKRGVNKSDSGLLVKRYKTLKGNKERVERTRTGIRRKTKSESTSTADEEALDSWESSMGEWALKYEEASTNQYTPEVQLLAGSLAGHYENDIIRKILEQLQVQLCRVIDFCGSKRLIASTDISQDQVIVEYKGKFLSTSQFYEQNPIFNKRSYPFVLFFKVDKYSEICVDAREYGSEARFVRRSCSPNAEVRPLVNCGLLHVYLFSLKAIKKEEEITIPYDFSFTEYLKEIDCACGRDDCSVISLLKKNGIKDMSSPERKKKGKKYLDTDENSQSSSLNGSTVTSSSPCKIQKSLSNKNPLFQSTPISHAVSSSADTILDCSKINQEEHETDEQSSRKMTREERKIDAIMRAFERMEKTAKRRQQALERIAQQKAQQKQETERDQPDNLEIKTETSMGEEESSNIQSSGDLTCEEMKSSLLISCSNNSIHNCRHKKGKRRRSSGIPARRRTRSNSGGSDIMSPDELPPMSINQTSMSTSVSPSNLITNVSASCCTLTSPTSAASSNNTFPKTKKFLMQEWLQEKAETSVPVSCPLTIHTELSWNLSTASPTCYVRCTRDSPNAGGISSAHLRRNSTSCSGQSGKSSSLGSAKKRWLRQAMFESGTSEIECSNFETAVLDGGQTSPLHNGCFSPNPHSDASSPCVSPPGDIVTPLKKRRLMRESLESLPSPRSPSPITGNGWPASVSSVESPEHSNSALEDTFPILNNKEAVIQIESVVDDIEEQTSTVEGGLNGLGLHLVSAAKAMREQWITKDESCDMEPTSSSGLNQDANLNEEKDPSPDEIEIPSVNANATDSSQDSSCLDLTCHDERESHVSSSESTVPVSRVHDDSSDLQIVNNVSSSTLCDSSEVSSTNKELSPAEDNKDSLPDSSLGSEIELTSKVTELDTYSAQQEQCIIESNCIQDCVTSSHFVNNNNNNIISEKQDSLTLYPSVESAQNASCVTTTTGLSVSSVNVNNFTSMSSFTNIVSSSISQKRKVSLSEYRMRMREQASVSTGDLKSQKSDNLPLVKTEDNISVQDSTASGTLSPKAVSASKTEQQTTSRQKDAECTEFQNEELDVRWNNNLLEIASENEVQTASSPEESESKKEENIKNQDQSSSNEKSVVDETSTPQLHVQPPPPPPLPSPSTTTKSNQVSQFRYPSTQTYCQQSFIVAQVASPFVTLPPQVLPLPNSIPVIHHSSHIPPPPPPPQVISVPPSTVNTPSYFPSTSAPLPPPPPPPPPPLPNGYSTVPSSQNFVAPLLTQSQGFHFTQNLFK